jgi:hypothetical protein
LPFFCQIWTLAETNASYDPLAKVFRNLTPRLGANEDGAKDMQVSAKKFWQKYAQCFLRQSDSEIVLPKDKIWQKKKQLTFFVTSLSTNPLNIEFGN